MVKEYFPGCNVKIIPFSCAQKDFAFRYQNNWWKKDNKIVNIANRCDLMGKECGFISSKIFNMNEIVAQRIVKLD